MYYEDLERWTREELSSHLSTLLAQEQLNHDDDLSLVFPVSIDTSSVLGGITDATPATLPQYAIDCESKELAAASEDGWLYDYSGQITIMVWADRADKVDAICRRHVAAVERWINSHMHPGYSKDGHFMIIEMRYSSTIFAGAIPLQQSTAQNPDAVDSWIAGADINLAWRLSESGPSQVD